MTPDTFNGTATFNDAVTSGLSAGVPGTPATWQEALDRWGTLSLKQGARRAAGRSRTAASSSTRPSGSRRRTTRTGSTTSPRRATCSCPTAQPPAVGTVFKNPDLAETYELLGTEGVDWLYDGELASEIVETVQHPPVAPRRNRHRAAGADDDRRPGRLHRATAGADPASTTAGWTVYGMGPPSSGGSTVGEALNILDNVNLSTMTRTQALHHYLEASALAYADRGAYLGDPAAMTASLDGAAVAGVRRRALLRGRPGRRDDQAGRRRRAGRVLRHRTATGPPTQARPSTARASPRRTSPWPTGGATSWPTRSPSSRPAATRMVVPRPGLPAQQRADRLQLQRQPVGRQPPERARPGKRPRSSMAPTIVLDDGVPFLALGSPGGSTIITTVLQMLINRLDLGMTLPQAHRRAAGDAAQHGRRSRPSRRSTRPSARRSTALGHSVHRRRRRPGRSAPRPASSSSPTAGCSRPPSRCVAEAAAPGWSARPRSRADAGPAITHDRPGPPRLPGGRWPPSWGWCAGSRGMRTPLPRRRGRAHGGRSPASAPTISRNAGRLARSSTCQAAATSYAGSPVANVPKSRIPARRPPRTSRLGGIRSACNHTGVPLHSGAASASSHTAATRRTSISPSHCGSTSRTAASRLASGNPRPNPSDPGAGALLVSMPCSSETNRPRSTAVSASDSKGTVAASSPASQRTTAHGNGYPWPGRPVAHDVRHVQRQVRPESWQPAQLLEKAADGAWGHRHPDRELVTQAEDGVLGAAGCHRVHRELGVLGQLLGDQRTGQRGVDVDLVMVQPGWRHPVIVPDRRVWGDSVVAAMSEARP